ncbi:MAG: PQQ-dependent sugar dehydrogenase, partial [Myxococcales bacterium]|nr:PQQ-dependent sugar dehydrogenase [Myxococcales bacterium]
MALATGLLVPGCGSNNDAPPVVDGDLPVGNCPEIYASGFRNPWRWSFDRATDELWVGDVGQGALEEVDRVVRGGNYGWRCFEGTRATSLPCGSEPNLLPPVAEYGRSEGSSITGGYVYRGM